jgi:hypothetical protein
MMVTTLASCLSHISGFLIPPARRFAGGLFSTHLDRMRAVDECPVLGGVDLVPNVADGREATEQVSAEAGR